MKAKDLRIGNYMHAVHENFSEVVEVLDISEDEINHSAGWDGVINYDLEYIPLTEEWLERLGFIRPEKFWGDEWRKDIYWLNADIFNEIKVGGNTVVYQLGIGMSKPRWQRTQLKYVHQLQNLYYALAEEELTIIKSRI